MMACLGAGGRSMLRSAAAPRSEVMPGTARFLHVAGSP